MLCFYTIAFQFFLLREKPFGTPVLLRLFRPFCSRCFRNGRPFFCLVAYVVVLSLIVAIVLSHPLCGRVQWTGRGYPFVLSGAWKRCLGCSLSLSYLYVCMLFSLLCSPVLDGGPGVLANLLFIILSDHES